MGGGIAQSIALRRPELVASLTLVATAAAGGVDHAGLPGPTAELAGLFDDPPPDPDWSDREAVVAWSLATEQVFAGPGFDEPRARAAAGAMFDRSHDPAAAGNHWLVAGGDERVPLDVHRIAVPTPVVHGAQDPMFPAAARRGTGRGGARCHAARRRRHGPPGPAAGRVAGGRLGAARGDARSLTESARRAGGHQREHAAHARDGERDRESPSEATTPTTTAPSAVPPSKPMFHTVLVWSTRPGPARWKAETRVRFCSAPYPVPQSRAPASSQPVVPSRAPQAQAVVPAAVTTSSGASHA